ncbi:MAG TPA: DUF1254 domain-containing protein [Candidatus Melainabacteria bacterium]|nr:DUF1254 domain-containing protein [Candidatus Melainabacteria bacterium]
MGTTLAQTKMQALTEKEAYEVSKEAYIYFYSLLSMEITRLQCTNLKAGEKPGFAPTNTFAHVRAYPDADFKTVVRPNFDTLYSVAWLDITAEPMIISIPDAGDRYYLLPLLDMWSDVFASPGWRTSGTHEQHYAIVSRDWSGKLPEGVEKIEAPTPIVWVIGRTKTDGPDDYAAVHKFQDGMKITPLSQWGKTVSLPEFKANPAVDMKTPPLEQVNSMSAEKYFSLGAELLERYSPHLTDWSTTERLKRIGIEKGKKFDFSSFDKKIQDAISNGVKDALQQMVEKIKFMGRPVNGWNMNTDSMGVYGSYYLKRAIVAMVGLGANQPEDAVYPLNIADSNVEPLHGDNKYVLHFEAGEIPPVDAFWSLTMYDKDGFQSANSINRFAISSWMPLKKNSDGSLDIYIQHENPGADKESNWLPAPKTQLGVTMRLYAPQPSVLTGDWNPPAIEKVK